MAAGTWTAAMPNGPPKRTAYVNARLLDPETGLDATGALLTPRDTAGGNFLYRFHFELHGLPREAARWIVGVATMAMFVRRSEKKSP